MGDRTANDAKEFCKRLKGEIKMSDEFEEYMEVEPENNEEVNQDTEDELQSN